jgi:hypothetical protein
MLCADSGLLLYYAADVKQSQAWNCGWRGRVPDPLRGAIARRKYMAWAPGFEVLVVAVYVIAAAGRAK